MCIRDRTEQAGDRRVAAIGCDQHCSLDAPTFGVNCPTALDGSNGGSITNLRSTFPSSSQQELIEDAALHRDFPTLEIRQRKTQRPPAEPDEFNCAEARVRQFEKSFAHAEAIENWPARRVQAIATDLFARKHAALEEDRCATRLRTHRRACRTRRTCADDCYVVLHQTNTSATASAIIRPRVVSTTRPARFSRNPSSRNVRSCFSHGTVSRSARPSLMRMAKAMISPCRVAGDSSSSKLATFSPAKMRRVYSAVSGMFCQRRSPTVLN